MKIVFLDVDGVLNSQRVADRIGWGGHFNESEEATHENVKWGQSLVDNLKEIVQKTGAQIVMSSTWRKFFSIEKFKEMFAVYNFNDAPVIDKTPGGYRSRGMEIDEWLADNPHVKQYVILDDYDDFLPEQAQYYVETDPEVGLSEEDRDKAIQILNGSYDKNISDRTSSSGS